MRKRSVYYYLAALIILLGITIPTIIKVFIDQHPLRYLFLIILIIGLSVGVFRYIMKLKRKQMSEQSKIKKYGILLLFILAYMLLKYGIKAMVSYEVSSQDYGIVMAFFFLGLFICYYGLYLLHLWKHKNQN